MAFAAIKRFWARVSSIQTNPDIIAVALFGDSLVTRKLDHVTALGGNTTHKEIKCAVPEMSQTAPEMSQGCLVLELRPSNGTAADEATADASNCSNRSDSLQI